MKKNNYQLIDLAKLFFAICVIGIHTQFLSEYKIGYYINTNIYRIAVPFFFICNGYFMAKSVNNTLDKKSKLFKLTKQYLFWCLLYTFLNNFFAVWDFSYTGLLNDIIKVFTFRSTNIMWYLGVLLIYTFIIYLVKDEKKLKILYLLSIAGYILGLSFVTYRYVFLGTKYEVIINFFDKLFTSNRYFPFTILFPFMGYFLNRRKSLNKISIYKILIFLIISQFLLLCETRMFYEKSLIFNEYDYFIFTPFVALLLFSFLIKCNLKFKFDTTCLRNLSKSLFFNHYIFIYLFHLYDKINYSKINGTDELVVWFRQSSFRMFIYVLLSTFIIYLISYKFKNKFIKNAYTRE